MSFSPMKIHKHYVIRMLEEHPEDFRKLCGSKEFKTAKQFIRALLDSELDWFVGGELKLKSCRHCGRPLEEGRVRYHEECCDEIVAATEQEK